jgi:hypothetical protein
VETFKVYCAIARKAWTAAGGTARGHIGAAVEDMKQRCAEEGIEYDAVRARTTTGVSMLTAALEAVEKADQREQARSRKRGTAQAPRFQPTPPPAPTEPQISLTEAIARGLFAPADAAVLTNKCGLRAWPSARASTSEAEVRRQAWTMTRAAEAAAERRAEQEALAERLAFEAGGDVTPWERTQGGSQDGEAHGPRGPSAPVAGDQEICER